MSYIKVSLQIKTRFEFRNCIIKLHLSLSNRSHLYLHIIALSSSLSPQALRSLHTSVHLSCITLLLTLICFILRNERVREVDVRLTQRVKKQQPRDVFTFTSTLCFSCHKRQRSGAFYNSGTLLIFSLPFSVCPTQSV